MQLQENAVVADRFRLVRMIGRGGMGSVWQAMHTGLDTPCAVKFIEGELADVADAHARFEREAKAAAQLRSPHVVQIIDHGVWQGRPYIAMELLDGEDLGKALAKAGGRISPAQVSTVIQQVCRALTKAHAAGIVHRDLKPDNIFLVNDDDRQIVKILDFGVAKTASQAIDGSNTKTGAMLGTPYYMSPEQAQGIKGVDARSDLWSLAVIVYQCITGRLPFESEALGDLLVKIIVQPVPVPSHVAPVPAGFDRWWAKAAERQPEKRFQTAKEFAAELEIALGGAPGMTEGPSAMAQLRGTAVMSHGTTPNPNAAPTGMQVSALVSTPHPGNPTPPGMVMGTHGVSGNLGASGNPVTFPGGESSVLPKKGPPVGLIAGFAVVAMLGILLTAFVVVRKTGATSGGHSPSGAVTASPVESAPIAKTEAPTAPTPVPSPEPPPPVAASSETPHPAVSASTAAAAPIKTGGAVRPSPAPVKTAAAAPTASAKKKWDPGF